MSKGQAPSSTIAGQTNLSTPYGNLMRGLTLQAAKERIPLNGVFELTSSCNLHCKMCYIPRGKPYLSHQKGSELTAAEWVNLAKEAKKYGLFSLLLSGGEIFLRTDFFDIYTPLTRIGILLTLFTNGTLIDATTAKRLALAPPHRTEITLYGATSATYEKVTGVHGSYKKCCTGIENLLNNRIPIALKTTLTQQNLHELKDMQRMANAWGVPFSASWLLFGQRDGSQSSIDNYRILPTECALLEAENQATAGEWQELALRGFNPDIKQTFYCQAGKSSFVINSFGEMNPCVEIVKPAAKPQKIGFMAAWERVQQFVDSAPSLSQACKACEHISYCRRCPASALSETGSLIDPVPYLCEVASANKKIL